MSSTLLSGVSVLVLVRDRATRYAAKLLCDLGAVVTEVVFPQSDGKTAPTRALDLYLDGGKRLVADGPSFSVLSETSELKKADVILCSTAGSVPLIAELRPENLRRVLPQAVIVSITPFGLDAEPALCVAADTTLQALGGISIGIGQAGRAPLKLPGDQSAWQSGVCAAIAALAGLFRGGALMDLSTADVWAAFYSGVEVANAHFGRSKKGRAGHRVSRIPYPRTILPCKDGYFAVQCSENRHWEGFLDMVGRPDLRGAPIFENRMRANDENGDECDQLFMRWFGERTMQEILELCLQYKIPGAPVYKLSDVASHEQLESRGYFQSVVHENSTARVATHPFGSMSATSMGALRPVAQMSDQNRAALPLAGIRVVDFGWVWAGAVPGHILADLGAEVIKVESRHPLDYMRQGRPIRGTQKDPEQNPMFHNVNRGKLSLQISLGAPGARALIHRLVARSDAVIENFSPGVMDKYGLSWDDLRQVRPGLVMCSMSAVGQRGPLRGIRTYATMIASLSGLDRYVRYPGERVLGSQSSYADPNASLHATVALLAALWRQGRTGEGVHLDVSQWESTAAVMGEELAELAMTGIDPSVPAADRHAVPCGNFPVQGCDEWIAIAVSTDTQWRSVVQILGNPATLLESRWDTTAGRLAGRAELEDRLSMCTRDWTREHLVEKLLSSGVPAAPLLRDVELAGHPQFKRRQLFELIEHPSLPPVPVYRLPWHVDGRPVPIARRAPMLGEHNDYVLREVLGLDHACIDSFAASGVFD